MRLKRTLPRFQPDWLAVRKLVGLKAEEALREEDDESTDEEISLSPEKYLQKMLMYGDLY